MEIFHLVLKYPDGVSLNVKRDKAHVIALVRDDGALVITKAQAEFFLEVLQAP